MSRRFGQPGAVLLAAFALAPGMAEAVVLFADDATQVTSGFSSTGPAERIARAFVPVASGTVRTITITVQAMFITGNNGGFTLELREDNSSTPGTLLGSVSGTVGFSSTKAKLTLSNGPALVAGTRYWAVFHAAPSDQTVWIYSALSADPEEVMESADSGLTWSRAGTQSRLTLALEDTTPVAVKDTYVAKEDIPLQVPAPGVLGNDEGPVPLTAVLVSAPWTGVLTLEASGGFSFSPPANQSGQFSFTYRAEANGLQSAPVTVTLFVDPVNDAPTFTNGPDVTVVEDSGAYSAAWATGISAGPGEPQTVNFTTSNNNSSLFLIEPSVSSTGKLQFRPAPNASGSATVTVTLTDDGGTDFGGVNTTSSTMRITVLPVNDPPGFIGGPDLEVPFGTGQFNSPGWASALYRGPADEAGQSLRFILTGNTRPDLFPTAPSLDAASGDLAFAVGTAAGRATLTFVLEDDGGLDNGGADSSLPYSFQIEILQPDGGSIPDGGNEPSDGGEPDAGRPDAGDADGGEPDAGSPDAGEPDAGPSDGGLTDGGPTDGGPTDGGRADAGGASDGGTDPDFEPYSRYGCGAQALDAPLAGLAALVLAWAAGRCRRREQR